MQTAMKLALVAGIEMVLGSSTELAIAQTPPSTPAPGRLVDIARGIEDVLEAVVKGARVAP